MERNGSARRAWARWYGVQAIIGAVAAAVIAVAVIPAGAETIVRKDGRKIEGQIVSEDETYVRVQTTFGTFRVRKSEIESISGRRAASANEREGRDALAAGDLDKALTKLQAAAKEVKDPNDLKEIQKTIAEVNQKIEEREKQRFSSQLAAARALVQDNKFNAARKDLEKLLQANVDDPAAAQMIRHQMGELHMAEAQYFKNQIMFAEAAAAYERAIEQMPENPEPYLKMADLLDDRSGDKRDKEDVIRYYTEGIRRALETGRGEEELLNEYYELGSAYISVGGGKDPDADALIQGLQALLVVLRHSNEKMPTASTKLEEGFVALSKTEHDRDEMVKMLTDTLSINPNAMRVRWVLSEVFLKDNRPEDAIRELLTVEPLGKKTGQSLPPEFYYRLGTAHLALPKPNTDAALAAFENELLQNKNNYPAMIKSAELLAAKGLYDQALQRGDAARRLREERPEAYVAIANIHTRRNEPGDVMQAQMFLKMALNVMPNYYQARLRLAEIEIERQTQSGAPNYEAMAFPMLKQVYDEIEKIDAKKRTEDDKRSQAKAVLLLAEIEMNKKNWRQVETYANLAVEKYPNLPEAYRMKAQALWTGLNESKEAVTAYEKAIELEPADVETYKNIGQIYQNDLKDFQNAIKYYQEYVDRNGPEKDLVTEWIQQSKDGLAAAAAAPAETTGTLPTSGTLPTDLGTTGTAPTTGSMTAPAPATGTLPLPAAPPATTTAPVAP